MSNVHEETRAEVTAVRTALADIEVTMTAASDLAGDRHEELMAHLRESQREQTAATIFAALVTSHDGEVTNYVLRAGIEQAVELADALRAELAKVKP
jgi:hypothetical protein